MNIAELFKKNFILVPVIASVLVGTFTGVRYIVNLTDTINDNQAQIVNLQRDLKVAQEKLTDQNTRLTSAESTWQMAENLYRQLADLLKKNFVLVPVVASVLVGTFTGVRYIVNLTDTINTNQQEIIDLKRDLKVAEDKIVDQNTRLTSAESTWQMAENLYRQLADQVREHSYDIKDLNR